MTYMILFLAGLAFSATPVDEATVYKNSFTCYMKVINTSRVKNIVEGFYVKENGQAQPLDLLIGPAIAQSLTDKRINTESKEALKKITDSLHLSYSCNKDGVAYNESRPVRSYQYICFPRENGVFRIEASKYLDLQKALDTANNSSAASASFFNYYLKMVGPYYLEKGTLLPPTPVLAVQVDAASRGRIKGTRSLEGSLENSVCSDSVKKAAKTPAVFNQPEQRRSRPGRR